MRRALSTALPPLPAAVPARIMPGQWPVATTVKAMEMPGVPTGLLAATKGGPITADHCVTVMEAAQGPWEMMQGNHARTFARFTVATGKLGSVMICRKAGSIAAATSTGTHTPTSFTIPGHSVTTGARVATVMAAADRRLRTAADRDLSCR